MRDRIIGRIAVPGSEHDDVGIRPHWLLEQLLLFDKQVLLSCRLLEFPHLVRQFGFGATKLLLESDHLLVKCDANQPVLHGSAEEMARSGNLFLFPFSLIRATDHDSYTATCRARLAAIDGLDKRQKQVLKRLAAERTDIQAGAEYTPMHPEVQFQQDFFRDLQASSPLILASIARELGRRTGSTIDPSSLILEFENRGNGAFFLARREGLPPLTEIELHDAIGTALIDVAAVYDHFALMSRYSALCEMAPLAGEVVDRKIDLLIKSRSSASAVNALHRALAIAGFPDLEQLVAAKAIKLERILELRHEREWVEFRQWLEGLCDASDDEIRDQINSIRSTLGLAASSIPGKLLRLIATTVIGRIGDISGVAASALDTFLVDKLLPVAGPTAFLRDRLPRAIDQSKFQKSFERGGLQSITQLPEGDGGT